MGATYNIDFRNADEQGRLVVAENIVIKKKNALMGLPITYSVPSLSGYPLNSPLYGQTQYMRGICDREIGVVGHELFEKKVSKKSGKSLEPVSIQLYLNELDNGRAKYRYAVKK
jgi:hypothetical protein